MQHTVAHLYPTGLKNHNGSIVGWRAVYEAIPEIYDLGSFSQNCQTWTSVDALVYGGIGADEFIFNFNVDATKVVSIEPRVLQFSLAKKTGKMKNLGKKRMERIGEF